MVAAVVATKACAQRDRVRRRLLARTENEAMTTMGPQWRKTAELISMKVPAWKAEIFDFLESEGFRFCVHFGIENCEQVARKHWQSVKHKRVIH